MARCGNTRQDTGVPQLVCVIGKSVSGEEIGNSSRPSEITRHKEACVLIALLLEKYIVGNLSDG